MRAYGQTQMHFVDLAAFGSMNWYETATEFVEKMEGLDNWNIDEFFNEPFVSAEGTSPSI